MEVVFSQDAHYSVRNYTIIDGLPQSQLTDITEDKNGYLWMCTEGGGLARFDGREFKVYTVADGLIANELFGVHFDKQERLWAMSSRGVSRYDGLQFKTFKMPDSLVSNRFIRIYEVNDSVFLLSMRGNLSKIYKDSVYYWEKPYHGKQIWRLHIGPKGEVVMLLEDGLLAIQTKNKIYDHSVYDQVGKVYSFFNWKGNLMLKGENGLFKVDLATGQLSKVDWNIKAPFVLQYDEKKNVFWTSDRSALFKETLNAAAGNKCDTLLRDVGINRILFDSEDNLWICTDGRGLFRYYIQDFYKCTPEQISGVMSVLDDKDGSLWIGTMAKGLWHLKNGKYKSFYDKMPLRNVVNCIKQTDEGNVWIATRYGLGKYDKTKDALEWYTSNDGLPNNFVMALETDDHGGMWVGTGYGICYYNGKTFTVPSAPDDLAKRLACWSLHYSKRYQSLFVATDDNLYAYTKEKLKTFSIDKLKHIVMTSMHEYRDSLLAISTGGSGIVILDPRNSNHTFITSREGLASDFNYFIAEDEKNYLWVGCEKGINRMRLNTKNEIVENLHYGFDNGLIGLETNQNSFSFTNNHKYFGLVDGLYTYNDKHADKVKSFDLHLSDVEILYGEYSSRDYTDSLYSFFKIPFSPLLPPDKNHVTFHFNRVDKQHPNSVKYKYFMENFDKAWSLPSSMQQATYGNLPPGDYVFRVMATNNNGSWSEQAVAYPFTVRSPFYMRASFIVGTFIFLGGIITLVLYLRVKQRIRKAVLHERIRTQEQELLRKEIARDFHDEMGNQLTRIINYVSLLKLNNHNGNGHAHNGYNHAELYGKVEESAKYLYSGTRDFIWAIDPVNDELNKLFIHIRDFGEKLFEEKNINFRAFNVITDPKDKVKLPYGFSREANLIFKESMTNAFKYSQAKNVTFSLHQYGDHYDMILEDDGVGFLASQIEKSNGLKNIRERADRINAILRISSNKDQGTKITLHFKLTKKPKYGLTI
jgi:ligand-binding sensor domain-containing protein/signal transduction histidine kinase